MSLLRRCAQAVVDAPLAAKPALRAEVLQLERDTMNQCSALFAVQRCVEGLVRVVSSRACVRVAGGDAEAARRS